MLEYIGDWRLYKDIKGLFGWINFGVLFLGYPRIVDFLNAIISFFYNVLGLSCISFLL
jgi:hypothetical protein